MAKINVEIRESSVIEWIHSVGYFLPRTELEMNRFERLHTPVQRTVKDEQVDPMAILNGSWQPRPIKPLEDDTLTEDIDELRMAARKSQGLPDHIIDKIRANNKKHGDSDNAKS